MLSHSNALKKGHSTRRGPVTEPMDGRIVAKRLPRFIDNLPVFLSRHYWSPHALLKRLNGLSLQQHQHSAPFLAPSLLWLEIRIMSFELTSQ